MCKVMIVEDHVPLRKILREILLTRFPTLSIEEERDESELFFKIDAFHPNIVFIDISLPKGNGLELTQKIKMNYSDIVVVIMASYDLPKYRQAATQSKADYFIAKNSPIQDFLALVESILPKGVI
jgi:DNA-binding NarL/FixJ family response regulator